MENIAVFSVKHMKYIESKWSLETCYSEEIQCEIALF